MEMFLNILCVLVPLLYLITYVAKQNKRRKRNYLYGLVVTIVLFLILFVIRLFVLTIIPTSGTTSESKGVMLSQRNICVNIEDMATYSKMYDNDVILSVLPLNHTFE